MKYSISLVSYINTIPFAYGLRSNPIIKSLSISLDTPSICAKKLLHDKIDIGLVPIVVLKDIEYPHIISDFCIGSNGYVDTVCLFSDVDINEIENVYIDYQSRTSVELLKILFKEYWNISPILLQPLEDYEKDIKGASAGLIIGDRVFQYRDKFRFCYDLSNTWKVYTGLPFVFACWVANKSIGEDFIVDFNTALSYGVKNIDKAVLASPKINHYCKDPGDYLKNKIDYYMDAKKKEAMRLFLNKI